ncbi:MAG: molybdate ABC transporter substrate-binding protein [Coriobacteriales bacterium]|jgi:molybdate transport system substrate-binding protein|nr:molybdate ABC transporter substrate-binding protein [Coriobacteriales bacterium]
MTKVLTKGKIAIAALVVALMAGAMLLLAGCGQQQVTLQIFAANSLQKALPEVQALYTQKNPNVTFADTQFKGSGDLVTELQGGASADALITASTSSMDNASKNGSIDDSTRQDMFGNDLVIAEGTNENYNITSLNDVTDAQYSKIAIGESSAVPAGAYANQALNTIGLYSDASGKGGTYASSFASKVVTDSSVGNVAQHVQSGDCQIGFVYSSDIYRYSGIKVAFTVPASAHKTITYPGAVCTGSQNAKAAADFLNFCMTDPDAQNIWSQYGFEVLNS